MQTDAKEHAGRGTRSKLILEQPRLLLFEVDAIRVGLGT